MASAPAAESSLARGITSAGSSEPLRGIQASHMISRDSSKTSPGVIGEMAEGRALSMEPSRAYTELKPPG